MNRRSITTQEYAIVFSITLGILLLVILYLIPVIRPNNFPLPGRITIPNTLSICNIPDSELLRTPYYFFKTFNPDLCDRLQRIYTYGLILAAIFLGYSLIGILYRISLKYRIIGKESEKSKYTSPISNIKTNNWKLLTVILIVILIVVMGAWLVQTNEISILQSQIAELKAENQQLKKELTQYKENFAIYSGIQPNYLNGLGRPIILVRNNAARDPTWTQLQEFLKNDGIDQIPYTSSYVCGDFAENLFSRAEAHGINAAFVAIHFSDKSESHALNAFRTLDKGLVYIDDTGGGGNYYQEISNPQTGLFAYQKLGYDKIAYVQVGKPLGVISLGTNYGLKYSDYEQWQRDIKTLEKALNYYEFELSVYNTDADNYNRANNPALTRMYNDLANRKIQLDLKRSEILAQENRLGLLLQPLGTVKNIELYW